MFLRYFGFLSATLFVLLTVARGVIVTGAEAPFVMERLETPAGAASVSPQLTTQGSRVILSWLEGSGANTALKFAERTASGWSDARTIVTGANLIVNSADVPSVRVLADKTLAAQWLEESGPDPEAYDLRVALSKDDGQTWSKPVNPHHDGTKTQHGFASLFDAPGGGLGLVWLDGRAINPSTLNGDMALRASSFRPNGEQGPEVVVDGRVCECCPTSTATTSEGVIVAYRDRSANETRDIFVSRLADGRWSTPTTVHKDGWVLDGCPVNGPAVTARGANVAVAWFTAVKDQGRAFVAFSRDAGRTFAAPVRVDDVSALGRVQLALLDDGSVAVSWVEFADGISRLKVRRVEAGGTRSDAASLADGLGMQHPRLAYGRDELIVAWTESSRGSTRVAVARAPVAAAKPGQ
jgi:hypothetical protein